MEQPNRWELRFSNFLKALDKMSEAVKFIENNSTRKIDNDNSAQVLEEIVKEGIIQRFEYTHELAWNVMKDYAAYQGNNTVGGSRDATREAFQLQLISDGQVWMDMIGSRNKTSHTYNEETAEEIYSKTLKEYYPAFVDFQKKMTTKKTEK